MKRYFIADVLTGMKFIPAIILIVAAFNNFSPFIALLLFAIGELLDALDGMAAHKWPHPEWTNELWFRKNIKVLESGLDMLLGIAALLYVMMQVDFWFGFTVLASALAIGVVCELILYGRILGSESQHDSDSLMARNPKKAKTIVAVRFVFYLIAVGVVMLRLLWAAFPSLLAKIMILIVAALVALIIGIKKYEDGRLEDVEEVAKKLHKK